MSDVSSVNMEPGERGLVVGDGSVTLQDYILENIRHYGDENPCPNAAVRVDFAVDTEQS